MLVRYGDLCLEAKQDANAARTYLAATSGDYDPQNESSIPKGQSLTSLRTAAHGDHKGAESFLRRAIPVPLPCARNANAWD